MKKSMTRAFLVFAALGLSAAAAPAQGDSTATRRDGASQDSTPQSERWGKRHRGRRGEHGEREASRGGKLRGLRDLDLTDAQREQLRAIRQKFQDSNRGERAELRQLWRIKKEGGELTPEQQARSRELINTVSQTGRSIEQEMLGVLTPEQRTRLDEMQQERKQQREERRRRRRERREQTTPADPR